MTPGIYEGLDFAQYLNIRAMSASSLKLLAMSYLNYRDGGGKSSNSLSFGTLAHSAILEPDSLANAAIVPDRRVNDSGKDVKFVRSGAHWDSWKKDRENMEIVREADFEKAAALSAAVNGNPAVKSELSGKKEVTIVWRRDDVGLCKCRFDVLDEDRKTGADLKTAADISPRAFSAAVLRYGYHIQAAWYLSGARAAGIDVERFVFIPVESSPPFDSTVYESVTPMIKAGESDINKAISTFLRGPLLEWPGKYPGKGYIDLPDYYYNDDVIGA